MNQRIVRISPELLMEFLKRPTPPGIASMGLPDDARIVDAKWNYVAQCIDLFVESALFDEAYGAHGEPSLLPLTFTRGS